MTFDSMEDMPSALEFTGERFVPEIEGDDALEHIHRYLMARELASGKVVLDIACGEGYGSAMLAEVASHVIGVDISEKAVVHASRKYTNENLKFREGRADAIPLAEGTVDLVVSFETIEHHDKHAEMMAEIHRVLRPEGLLLISSPDKHEYSDVPGYSNPFHVKELYLEEFTALLRRHFQNIAVLGQRVCFGSVITSEKADEAFSIFVEQDGGFTREGGIPRPRYFVAVASNARLPALGTSFYELDVFRSTAANLLAAKVDARDQQIAVLDRQLRDLRESLDARDQQIAALDRQLRDLRESLDARDQQIAVLDRQLRELWESTSWRLTKPMRTISRQVSRLLRNG